MLICDDDPSRFKCELDEERAALVELWRKDETELSKMALLAVVESVWTLLVGVDDSTKLDFELLVESVARLDETSDADVEGEVDKLDRLVCI